MKHNSSSFVYQIDILMVADYSVYTNFLNIVRGDEYSAFFATQDYLYAIFEQVNYSRKANEKKSRTKKESKCEKWYKMGAYNNDKVMMITVINDICHKSDNSVRIILITTCNRMIILTLNPWIIKTTNKVGNKSSLVFWKKKQMTGTLNLRQQYFVRECSDNFKFGINVDNYPWRWLSISAISKSNQIE